MAICDVEVIERDRRYLRRFAPNVVITAQMRCAMCEVKVSRFASRIVVATAAVSANVRIHTLPAIVDVVTYSFNKMKYVRNDINNRR